MGVIAVRNKPNAASVRIFVLMFMTFAASSLVERSRVAVFDFRCLSDLLRCGQWVDQASFHHFPFDGFFFSLLGANVAIVAKAAAGIVRPGEAAHHLHTCQDEFLVTHVAGVRVCDCAAPAAAYGCGGRCNYQLEPLLASFVVFIVFIGL